MSQEAPDFADGNKAFAKALNKVVEYCRRHGLNPAGRSGWSESIDGWVPPYTDSDNGSGRFKQWQIRVGENEGNYTAAIRAGTLTGLGLSDYGWNADPEWEDGEWVPVDHGEQIWLILRIVVSGSPLTYFSSPGTVQTIYLPSQVDSATAELYAGSAPPLVSAPTVDFATGNPAGDGVYRFLIGSTSGGGATNHYLGPLGIGWCAPDTAHLTALTVD